MTPSNERSDKTSGRDDELDRLLQAALAGERNHPELRARIMATTREQFPTRAPAEPTRSRPLPGWPWMSALAGAATLMFGIYIGSHDVNSDPLNGLEAEFALMAFGPDFASDKW